MNELENLYQEVIIDHSQHPRNFFVCSNATCQNDGYNSLCGDKLTVYVTIKDDILERLCFQGSGCAIFMASASIMTEVLTGSSLKEMQEWYQNFHQLLTTGKGSDAFDFGKLKIFAGVAEFPVRVKCATLPWHTLKGAIANI